VIIDEKRIKDSWKEYMVKLNRIVEYPKFRAKGKKLYFGCEKC